MSEKTTEIIPYKPEQHTELVARIRAIDVLRQSDVFVKGIHYGEPYKDAGKDVLLKPGAETIMSRFLLWPDFIERSKVENWDADNPLFHYRYECRLIHRETGQVWGAGIGSCNSMEDKYRWRNKLRVCPQCGAEAIRRSGFPKEVKPEKRGWYCHAKSGGCNAKFDPDAPEILKQEEGKVPNDEVFTLVNTIDKMAQKRALVAAVLIATGASAYFTQDVEEFPGYTGVVYDSDGVIDGTYTESVTVMTNFHAHHAMTGEHTPSDSPVSATPEAPTEPEPDESPVPAAHDRAASTQEPETRDVAHEAPDVVAVDIHGFNVDIRRAQVWSNWTDSLLDRKLSEMPKGVKWTAYFWAGAKNGLGLTEDEVHKIIGKDSVNDWDDTLRALLTTLVEAVPMQGELDLTG